MKHGLCKDFADSADIELTDLNTSPRQRKPVRQPFFPHCGRLWPPAFLHFFTALFLLFGPLLIARQVPDRFQLHAKLHLGFGKLSVCLPKVREHNFLVGATDLLLQHLLLDFLIAAHMGEKSDLTRGFFMRRRKGVFKVNCELLRGMSALREYVLKSSMSARLDC